MPCANTQAMQHHLDEIARTLAPKAHAILVLDQAGWHTTDKLRLPQSLSLLPLPSKSPELNPVENVWQFLRQTKLSNRIFAGYEAIVTAAWRLGTASLPIRPGLPQSEPANGLSSLVVKGGQYQSLYAPRRHLEQPADRYDGRSDPLPLARLPASQQEQGDDPGGR
jgi:hypothetical protein